MTPLSLIRIASFLLTVAVAAGTGPSFVTVVPCIALVHYLVAMVYSRRQIANVISKPVPTVLASLLSLSAVALYVAKASLSVLFLPHHVFNEIYVGKKELFPGREHEARWFIWSSLLFNAALYSTIFTERGGSNWLFSPQLTQPLLIVSGAWFAVSLFQLRQSLSRQLLFDACLLELLTAAAIVIGQFQHVTIMHIALYHFTFWGLYPLHKMWNPGSPRPSVAYVAMNVALVALVLAVSQIGPFPLIPTHVLREQFAFWSIFHIMISVALSKAQPEWIWRIFQPPPAFVIPGAQDLSKTLAAPAAR